jgi:hypothetical protein
MVPWPAVFVADWFVRPLRRQALWRGRSLPASDLCFEPIDVALGQGQRPDQLSSHLLGNREGNGRARTRHPHPSAEITGRCVLHLVGCCRCVTVDRRNRRFDGPAALLGEDSLRYVEHGGRNQGIGRAESGVESVSHECRATGRVGKVIIKTFAGWSDVANDVDEARRRCPSFDRAETALE